MAITFVPDAGDVLMCDFKGLQPPEIHKRRRVIVLSPRSRDHIPSTFLVVPISKTSPATPRSCHCEFKPRSYHFFDPAESVWALGDMVIHVASWRLDRMLMHGKHYRAQVRLKDLIRAITNLTNPQKTGILALA